jgi:putative transposase
MQRKLIPKEIKDEILEKVKLGIKVMDLARQYGISDKSIYNWLHQDTNEEVISLVKYNRLKRENEELKRLIGELTLDMSLEKKGKAR